MILQEFDLDFVSTKSKKYLVFVELIPYLPKESEDHIENNSFLDEHIFLISYDDL
jgi:hypothetical protein